MTNLPKELGIAIFKQILSTPKPDYEKIDAEAKALEKKILEARQKRNAQGNSAR
jgi:hypothetical protein